MSIPSHPQKDDEDTFVDLGIRTVLSSLQFENAFEPIVCNVSGNESEVRL